MQEIYKRAKKPERVHRAKQIKIFKKEMQEAKAEW